MGGGTHGEGTIRLLHAASTDWRGSGTRGQAGGPGRQSSYAVYWFGATREASLSRTTVVNLPRQLRSHGFESFNRGVVIV